MEDVPVFLSKLNDQNYGYKVKLRYRKPNQSSAYLLYLDYYNNGKRRTKTLHLKIIGDKKSQLKDKETMQIALTMRNQLEQKVLAGETGIIVTKQNEVDFIAFFKQYSKLKPDSNYKISCQHFQNFIGKESFDIKKIDIPLCEQYKEYLLSLDMTAYSALHYFITFKATLNYAVSLKKISNNPAKHISIKYDRKTIERLTLEEVQALMETDCKYSSIKNGFLFSCFTGLRLSDIKNLKFSDIKNNRIKFIQKKTKDEVEFKVHPTAQKIIEEQIKTKRDEFVFHIPDGGKTSQRLRNWIQSAGIEKKITFHCSRHTFGCLLIENGVDVFTVKKLMGHRDIKTTLQYVEKVDETKDKGIDRIPVI